MGPEFIDTLDKVPDKRDTEEDAAGSMAILREKLKGQAERLHAANKAKQTETASPSYLAPEKTVAKLQQHVFQAAQPAKAEIKALDTASAGVGKGAGKRRREFERALPRRKSNNLY